MSIDELVAMSEPMPPTGGFIEGSNPLSAPLGLHSLLVRESVQNSWDARDDARGDRPVTFRIDAWDLDGDRLDDLRSLMPVDHLAGFARDADATGGITHPADSIEHSSVRTLTISDRDTVGLCGPTTSGTAWEPVREGVELVRGQPRFANFVRNQGRAKKDIGHGDGGAFGIGKSVLWLASKCGTILIHTRTSDADGRPVERFIGVVHGHDFASDEHRFTGRHFIGRADAEQPRLIQPLEGADAADARRRLPIPSYEKGGIQVFGTSIVIIDPYMSDDWQDEMLRLRDAVRWQVWPKLLSGVRSATGGPDMTVHLGWNNNAVPVPDPTQDSEIVPYAKTLLDCVRDRSLGEPDSWRDNIIDCQRPKKVLGDLKFRRAGTVDENVFHLTGATHDLDRQRQDDDPGSHEVDPVVPFEAPWGQIALIRREPLLLVRYEPLAERGTRPSVDASVEVGVFLSAQDDEVEAALTRAEPPAHDDWIPAQIRKEHRKDYSKTYTRVTLKRLQNAKSNFLRKLRDVGPGHIGGPEQEFAKRISRGLLAGFGGAGGQKRPRGQTTGGKRRQSARGSVELRLVTSRPTDDGVAHELALKLTTKTTVDGPVTLCASGSARDNVGTLDLDGTESFRWTTAAGDVVEGPTLETTIGEIDELALEVTLTRAVRFRPSVVIADDEGGD